MADEDASSVVRNGFVSATNAIEIYTINNHRHM
jgi:hypothetical protein